MLQLEGLSIYLHVFILYVDLELFVEKTSIYLHVFLLYVDLELFVEKTLVIETLLKRKWSLCIIIQYVKKKIPLQT